MCDKIFNIEEIKDEIEYLITHSYAESKCRLLYKIEYFSNEIHLLIENGKKIIIHFRLDNENNCKLAISSTLEFTNLISNDCMHIMIHIHPSQSSQL